MKAERSRVVHIPLHHLVFGNALKGSLDPYQSTLNRHTKIYLVGGGRSYTDYSSLCSFRDRDHFQWMDKDNNLIFDEKGESRLYVGNLDLRITEATLIKMFSPFGKIAFEDFLWHTRGPKRGEPRGYAFVQFSTKEEATRAKEKMHGKLVHGRPLVVRFVRDKYLMEMEGKTGKSSGSESNLLGNGPGQTSRSAKIAAIKNKLKAMEGEDHDTKRQKQS